jgi:stringent starvation protein A
VVWYGRGEAEGVAEQLRAQAALHTRDLQAWLEAQLGPDDAFLGRETFGWADCAAAPLVDRSVHYELGPAPGSRLQQWHARLKERPSVRLTFAGFDAGVAAATPTALKAAHWARLNLLRRISV